MSGLNMFRASSWAVLRVLFCFVLSGLELELQVVVGHYVCGDRHGKAASALTPGAALWLSRGSLTGYLPGTSHFD